MGTVPARDPDIGDPVCHPTAGAVVTGARKFLIAYNINLNTPDVAIAKRIAKTIRFSSGGFRYVKSMGVMLASRNLAQVSINLTDFEQTPMHVVFEAVRREAERYGVTVAGSEIVGLIPRKAIELSAEYFLRYENFRPELVLENRIAEALAARGGLPEFLDALASPSATPGGGSAAAAAAAMAAALGSMVTRLAKLDSEAFEDDRRFFTAAVDRDADAFNQVMLAYKRPKAERAPFIEEALHGAAEVPLQVTERIHALQQRLDALEDPGKIRQRSGGGQGPGSRCPRGCAGKRQHQSGVNRGRRFQECGSPTAASTGMKTDLAIVNCRQVVTLAGPPGPRSGPAMRELAIIADGASAGTRRQDCRSGYARGNREGVLRGHRNRRCRRTHRSSRLCRRSHASGIRGQPRRRV